MFSCTPNLANIFVSLKRRQISHACNILLTLQLPTDRLRSISTPTSSHSPKPIEKHLVVGGRTLTWRNDDETFFNSKVICFKRNIKCDQRQNYPFSNQCFTNQNSIINFLTLCILKMTVIRDILWNNNWTSPGLNVHSNSIFDQE